MQVCDFWSGTDQVAESSVMTFKTVSTTAQEFRSQITGRASSKPHSVSGPWKKAYRISTNEIFVLEGRHIFHIQFTVRTTAKRVRVLAKRAATEL